MLDNNELYQRQQSLEVNPSQSIAIIGCGGIGSWIAIHLALAGVNWIDLYDGDKLEAHNLNRFPLGPDAIGKYKSEAIAAELIRLRPDIEVTPRMNFEPDIHADKLVGYHWVIVSTDSLKSRRMVYNEVLKYKGNYPRKRPFYIEAGADGVQMTVSFAPADFSTDEEDNPGYRSVPVMVGPCTLAASIVTYYVLMGLPNQDSFHATWDNTIARTLILNKFSDADVPEYPEQPSNDDLVDELRAAREEGF
jgi:hypothetical protein